MTLRYYYYFFKLCKKSYIVCSFPIEGHYYHCGIVYQHAKYHYYMSVTFSLSLPNVDLIRLHMFYCLNTQIRHMQMTYWGNFVYSSNK